MIPPVAVFTVAAPAGAGSRPVSGAEAGFDAMLAAAAGFVVAGSLGALVGTEPMVEEVQPPAAAGTDPPAVGHWLVARSLTVAPQPVTRPLEGAPAPFHEAPASGEGAQGDPGDTGVPAAATLAVAPEGSLPDASTVDIPAAGVDGPRSTVPGRPAVPEHVAGGPEESSTPQLPVVGEGSLGAGAAPVDTARGSDDAAAPLDGGPSDTVPETATSHRVARGPVDVGGAPRPVARGPVDTVPETATSHRVARGPVDVGGAPRPVARGPVEAAHEHLSLAVPGGRDDTVDPTGRLAAIEPQATGPSSTRTEPPVSLPAFPARVVEVAHHARRIGDGAQRLVVRLDPPELGTVHADLVVRGDEVHLVLRGERSAVELLREARDPIERALRQEGFALGGFDVSARDDDRPRRPVPRARFGGINLQADLRGHEREGLRL